MLSSKVNNYPGNLFSLDLKFHGWVPPKEAHQLFIDLYPECPAEKINQYFIFRIEYQNFQEGIPLISFDQVPEVFNQFRPDLIQGDLNGQ